MFFWGKHEGIFDIMVFGFFKAAHVGVAGMDSGDRLPGSKFQPLPLKSCVIFSK